MVPPLVVISRCSFIIEMTGNLVSASISVEFAPCMPATLRAYSTTASCMPKQMPKNGTAFSRAKRIAAILPSVPRAPKPGAHRIPSTSAHATSAPMRSISSESM